MFKKLGIPVFALGALLVFAVPHPAKAAGGVHFGITLGNPAYGYDYPIPYDEYPAPYAYSYAYPYEYPYTSVTPFFGGHEYHEHGRYEHRGEAHRVGGEYHGGGHEHGGHGRH
jgi:hypothetical protein